MANSGSIMMLNNAAARRNNERQAKIKAIISQQDFIINKNGRPVFLDISESATDQILSLIESEIEQIISERDKEIIKMLENTDVQMSVSGDVSQDEIAMAKFLYKAHIRHIIKKIGSAIIPPNPINGTLPSETDSATK